MTKHKWARSREYVHLACVMCRACVPPFVILSTQLEKARAQKNRPTSKARYESDGYIIQVKFGDYPYKMCKIYVDILYVKWVTCDPDKEGKGVRM